MRAAAGLALMLALLLPMKAMALDVVVDSAQVASEWAIPKTVTVDVWLALDGGEVAPDLSGFQVAVELSGPGPGVTLAPPASGPTGAHPALITENFVTNLGGSDGPARVTAAALLDSGSVTITDGGGLISFDIDISAGASGVYTLAIDLDPFSGTVLGDPEGAALSFSAIDGAITVAPPVPALPVAAHLAMGLAIGSAGIRALRRRAA